MLKLEQNGWHGFLNVDKPQGMTSHDVVAKIRRQLPKKTKVGHTGTLDPDATGVLPICIGKATRLAEYFHAFPKCYWGEMTLGKTTDSQDSSGQVLSVAPAEQVAALTLSDLEEILPEFLGEIQQVPPMVSAIKINGKKLYELARQGQEVERPARTVTIFDLTVLQSDFTLPNPKITLAITCSSGTYIRTLFHDLGQRLGVGAYLSRLSRQAVGKFHLAEAWPLAELEERLAQKEPVPLLPLHLAVSHLPKIELQTEKQCAAVLHGRYLSLPQAEPQAQEQQVWFQDTLLGIGKVSLQILEGQEMPILQMRKVLAAEKLETCAKS